MYNQKIILWEHVISTTFYEQQYKVAMPSEYQSEIQRQLKWFQSQQVYKRFGTYAMLDTTKVRDDVHPNVAHHQCRIAKGFE